jgi:hypothetical protein
MAEHDDWTAADDAGLRAALASLRTDVEAVPLPDVRFVKARGMARRRRRFLAVGAAAAVAAIVAGTVGYDVLRPDGNVVHLPAARTSTTSAAPSPTTTPSSLDQPGALPLLQEWVKTLGLEGDARMTTQDPKSGDYRSFECLTIVPEGQKLRQEITLDAGGFQGGQAQFAVSTGQKPATVARGLTNAISQCQQGPDFHVNRLDETDAGSLYSYTAGDAGSGWFVVVTGDSDVALLQVTDPTRAKSRYTLAQVTALAEVAQQRLALYGTGATALPTAFPTGSTSPTGATEKMTVAGPDPVPPASLFVPPSSWKNPLFANGAATTSGPGALEGSTAIVACEDDTQQAGIAGRVGVVSIRIGTGTQSYIGNQRVRVFDDVDASSLVTADLARTDDLVMKGCQTPGGARTTTQAGPTQGTYLLTTRTGDQTLRQWVGITPMRTAGGVTTITFHSADAGPGFTGTDDQGFALLDGLLHLARAR